MSARTDLCGGYGATRIPTATASRRGACAIRGWRIRHDTSCRDVCAPWDRAAQRADVPLFGVRASQGRTHPGKERLDVCATRGIEGKARGHKRSDRSLYAQYYMDAGRTSKLRRTSRKERDRW